MTQEERKYFMKVSAIAIIFGVMGVIVAIKMKKGFWVGFGFYILGSLLGGGIGRLVMPYPESAASSTDANLRQI